MIFFFYSNIAIINLQSQSLTFLLALVGKTGSNFISYKIAVQYEVDETDQIGITDSLIQKSRKCYEWEVEHR